MTETKKEFRSRWLHGLMSCWALLSTYNAYNLEYYDIAVIAAILSGVFIGCLIINPVMVKHK